MPWTARCKQPNSSGQTKQKTFVLQNHTKALSTRTQLLLKKKSFCFSILYPRKQIFQVTESRAFGKLIPVWKILRDCLHQDRQKLRFLENDNNHAHIYHIIHQHGMEWKSRFFLMLYLQRHKWTLKTQWWKRETKRLLATFDDFCFADKWSERSLWRSVTFPLPRS